MRQERSKMNIDVDLCEDHGVFLDRQDIGTLVSEKTTRLVEDIIRGSSVEGNTCPTGHARMRITVLNTMPVQGCMRCSGLWFRNKDLQDHVLQVRKRAYGEGSMAARLDVMRDATAFYPAETVAGILTDFELEHEL
jgi:Zn-finger nucleic acid-binding protein